MTRESVEARKAEFEEHVWNHADDAFQKSFDEVPPLKDNDRRFLEEIIAALNHGASDDELASLLRRRLRSDPSLTWSLLQIVGLTRNKIIQDMRGITSAAEATVRVPGTPDRLAASGAVWPFAGPYLVRWCRQAFEPLTGYDNPAGALKSMREVTWPGYIRQERAKRQGHEAEHRIAIMLAELGIPFVPEEKVENPLCRDAQIGGISYDIVSPGIENATMVVKSTVQTANIGQFGESKAHLEVDEAQRTLIDNYGDVGKPQLVSFVDGVGFRSNVAGLNGVLEKTDEFAQFRTLWKVAVVAVAGIGGHLTVALVPQHAHGHASFVERWSGAVEIVHLDDGFRAQLGEVDLIEGGEALIRRDD